jgi:hypothetical protein
VVAELEFHRLGCRLGVGRRRLALGDSRMCGSLEAYKKKDLKFTQRLVANQKARVKES